MIQPDFFHTPHTHTLTLTSLPFPLPCLLYHAYAHPLATCHWWKHESVLHFRCNILPHFVVTVTLVKTPQVELNSGSEKQSHSERMGNNFMREIRWVLTLATALLGRRDREREVRCVHLEWWISCALRRLNLKTASPKNVQETPNPLSLGLLWNSGRLPDLENKKYNMPVRSEFHINTCIFFSV